MKLISNWLIPEWRLAHKMLSVRLAALLAVLSVVQAQVLPIWQFVVPAQYWPWVSAGFATAIVVGRLVQQRSVSGDAGEPKP